MNEQQKAAAIERLSLFEVEPPYTEAECQKIVKTHQDWWRQVRADRVTLGYYAATQEAVNEIKANRLSSN